MSNGDVAIVGMGQSDSPNRAEEAARNALNERLLDVDYEGADSALIHVSGGSDMSLGEAVRAAETITELMDQKAMVIWGARVDPNLNKRIRVTLVLTGIRSPHLLSNYETPQISHKTDDVKLFNLEPYAKPEAPLSMNFGLYDMEKTSRFK